MSRSTLLPTRKHPVEKHVFEQLEDSIDYGEVIKWHIIEEIADMPRLVHGIVDPKFAFMWMQVSQMLEGKGFFTTERGLNGEGFRVLQREEVASITIRRSSRTSSNGNAELLVCPVCLVMA